MLMIPSSVRKWIPLVTGIVIIGLTFLATRSYYVAVYNDKITTIKAEHSKAVTDAQTKHNQELQALNTRIQTVQDELTTKTRELNNALKQKQNSVISGIGSGTIRLRDKHATSTCTNSSTNHTSNPNAATGQPDNRVGTGNELSRQTSEDLVRLATDAEQTNIALKACIQQYNNIREQLHE